MNRPKTDNHHYSSGKDIAVLPLLQSLPVSNGSENIAGRGAVEDPTLSRQSAQEWLQVVRLTRRQR
jgi:hypothetical protein